MNETQRRFLRNLRDAQPAGLRRSSIPNSCAELLQELTVCGAVEFRPAAGGRGIKLCVSSEQAFVSFIEARLPQGLDIDVSCIGDRASAVLYLADAKALRCAVAQGLLVRSVKEGVEIHSADQEVVIRVNQLTTSAGGSVVQLSADKNWTFSGDVVLIENADAFWQYEAVLPDADLAIFAGGNMSDRLIGWLASPEMARCRLAHWGDYDPVGVCQYLRLLDACPGRVEPFAPPIIDELLPTHGKRRLVTRQSRYLDRLRRRMEVPYVHRMIALFDRHRRGLEQEVLLHGSITMTAERT